MSKQYISKEQFIKICTEYGFEVKERPEPWRITKTWFLAYIPNYDEAIAAYVPEDHETIVCVELDCLYDGHEKFQVRKTCQPRTVEIFKFFLGEVNKTVKNHIVNMKISKMREEDFG